MINKIRQRMIIYILRCFGNRQTLILLTNNISNICTHNYDISTCDNFTVDTLTFDMITALGVF